MSSVYIQAYLLQSKGRCYQPEGTPPPSPPLPWLHCLLEQLISPRENQKNSRKKKGFNRVYTNSCIKKTVKKNRGSILSYVTEKSGGRTGFLDGFNRTLASFFMGHFPLKADFPQIKKGLTKLLSLVIYFPMTFLSWHGKEES